MKQTIFETRQRASEILKETIAIWRQSDQSDYLEGIEDDPIFSLLMMALAYRANESEGEIERLKSEVLDEFARLLAPYEVGHAIPATAVVKNELSAGVTEQTFGADTPFMLADYPFVPLLGTGSSTTPSIVRSSALPSPTLTSRTWRSPSINSRCRSSSRGTIPNCLSRRASR